MKGIFPPPCRWAGYGLLLLSVFVPMLMYMFGMVDDGNLLYVKLGMKCSAWSFCCRNTAWRRCSEGKGTEAGEVSSEDGGSEVSGLPDIFTALTYHHRKKEKY